MGYDIHCYLEVKTVNDKWHGFGESFTRLNRNYTAIPVYKHIFVVRNRELFSVLSGIHAEEGQTIMFPTPRGLPYDLSYEIQLTLDSLVEHIHDLTESTEFDFSKKNLDKSLVSYATYTELNKFADEHPETLGAIQYFKNSIADEVKYGAENDPHPDINWNSISDDRKRVIFFYDW